MFSLLYNKLPGGRFFKILQLSGIVLAVVAVLFFLIFPTFDSLIPEDPSIDG